mgnify:CR=1 FL=1
MDINLKREKFFNHENIKISIELDNYCLEKEGFLEGFINLVPIFKGEIKLSDPKLQLILTQYEFFEQISEEKRLSNKELKNNQQHKEIIFDKESKIELENNIISSKVKVPIKISIPKNDKLLSSFNLKTKDFISGIRHIFTVKIPEISAIESIGVFFCDKEKKENNVGDFNNIFKEEQINQIGLINKGKISYYIRTAKNSYKNDENIDIKIMVDSSGLQEIDINQIIIKLQRKITILGYTVNSDLRYTLSQKVFESNELKKKNSKNYELEYSIPKIDGNIMNEQDIKKYIHFLENNNNESEEKYFSPTIKGYFFNCEYKIKIRTNLDSKLISTKKIDIPLQIYISEDYFNKKNEKVNEEKEKDK